MAIRKRGKRGNGEGSITRRADGRYMAQLSIGRNPVTGKLRRISFYGKTRQEVASQLTKALSDRDRGSLVAPHKLMVGQWLDTWLSEYKRPAVRAITYDFYESMVRNHLKPFLGHVTLTALRSEHVQRLYNEKAASGLSAKTIGKIHLTLNDAVKQALINGLVSRNATIGTKRQKGTTKERVPLRREETRTFLESIKGERLYPGLLLAVMSGARRSELLAVQWEDIDFDAGLWHVRRAFSRVKTHSPDKNMPKTKLIMTRPKTEKGRREIPLVPEVVSALRHLKARQAQERLLLGEAFTDQGLVFCYPNGSPLNERTVLRNFQTMLSKVGLRKVRLHDVRHGFATVLLEMGEHPKVVQTLLGHSSIAVTLDVYSHVSVAVSTKAVNALSAALNGQR